jgi:lysM domain protein
MSNKTDLNNTIGMSNDTYQNLKNIIAYRESGGNQYSVNGLGFMGKYQFGAEALADTGFIDKSKLPKKGQRYSGWQNDFLADDSNWTIKGGKQAFLNNVDYQEQAMDKLLKSNYNQISKGIGYTDEKDLSGKLMASHLGGYGNTKKLFLEGKGFKDAYGTDIMQYYKLGSKAGSNDETFAYLPKNMQNMQKFQGKISNPEFSNAYIADNKSTIPTAPIGDNINEKESLADTGNIFSNIGNSVSNFLFGKNGTSAESMQTLLMSGGLLASGVSGFFGLNTPMIDDDEIEDDEDDEKPRKSKQTDDNKNYEENKQSNLDLFPSIIDKIANSQEQLNTIIKLNPTADNTPLLKKHYEINKKIQETVDDYYKDSFDEQNTNISLHKAQLGGAIIGAGVMKTIVKKVKSSIGSSGGLGIGDFLKGGAVALIGSKLLKSVFKPLKFFFNPKLPKFIGSLPTKIEDLSKSLYKYINKFDINGLKSSFQSFKQFAESKFKSLGTLIDNTKATLSKTIDDIKAKFNKPSTPAPKVETPKPKVEPIKPIENINKPKSVPTAPVKEQRFFGKLVDNTIKYTKKSYDYVASGKLTDDIVKGYNYSKDFIVKTADDVANFASKQYNNAKAGLNLLKDKATSFMSEKVLKYITNIIPPKTLKILKVVGKKIPGVSLIAGLAFGADRLLAGDFTGAVVEVLSGIAGSFPGLGTLASIGLDSALLAKDAGMLPDEFNEAYKDFNKSIEGSISSVKQDKTSLDSIKTPYSDEINEEIEKIEKLDKQDLINDMNRSINQANINSDYIEKQERNLPNIDKPIQTITVVNYGNSDTNVNVNSSNKPSMNLSDSFSY